MNDQAANLRRKVQLLGKEKRANVISIVSGKGGVGKSNIAVNLAIALSKYNKKVLLIDLDVGMANVDILLGCKSKYHIVDMIDERLPIWDIMESTEYNISFIAGGNGLSDLFELTSAKFDYFISQFEQVMTQFDFIILDIGAGVSKGNLKFILASDEVSVISTTEPTSITDAYAMMKHIHQYKQDSKFYLIVNRCTNDHEGIETANRLIYTVRHYLNKAIHLKGYIPDDRSVTEAVKRQIPLLVLAPKSKASIAIEKLAITYIKEGLTRKSKPHSVIQVLRQLFLQR